MRRIGIFLLLLISLSGAYGQILHVYNEDSIPQTEVFVLFYDLNEEMLSFERPNESGVINIPNKSLEQGELIIAEFSSLTFEQRIDTLDPFKDHWIYLQADPNKLDQVVVTGQYGNQVENKSLHKITVIDRNEIMLKGAVNLRDALDGKTNLRLSQDNILGSSISMQGLSGRNVKILVDGVPIIGRLDGNLDLSQFNLEEIERIEIVEGPMSVIYGTDALAGTINLITKKGSKENIQLSANSYYETVGQYNLAGRLGYRLNNHQIALSGGRNYFDGWSVDDPLFNFPKRILADSGRVQDWNPKEQYNAKLNYGFNRNDLSIQPYMEFFSEEIKNKGLPRSPYYETAFDDIYFTRRLNAGSQFAYTNKADKLFKTVIAYNSYYRTKNTYYTDLTTLDSELTTAEGDQDTTRYSTLMNRFTFSNTNDSSQFHYEFGYDIEHSAIHTGKIEGVDQQFTDAAVFLSSVFSLGSFTEIKPGIRYGYNSIYQTQPIPSVHM